MIRLPGSAAIMAILLAAVAASGCGLKGPLVLPPKSDEVVIRAPASAQATPTDGTTTTVPAPSGETEQAVTPARPQDERIPPPPLPGGGAGT
jgi:predicted small lipoprotein YifL